MPKITLNNVTVSDAYMALLADRGIDYWFANAGTDFAPVVETLAKAQVLETKVPSGDLSAREYRYAHGHRLLFGHGAATGGDGARQRRHRQRDERAAQRGAGPRAVRPRRAERRLTKTDLRVIAAWIFIGRRRCSIRRNGSESVKWDYEATQRPATRNRRRRGADNRQEQAMGPVYLSLPQSAVADDG